MLRKIAFLIIVLALVAWLGTHFLGTKKDNMMHRGRDGAVQVLAIKAKSQKIAQKIQLSGRVVALKTSEIRPQISGIVKRRNFVEGAHVEAGKQLYQINEAPFLANLAAAKADLAASEASFEAAKYKFERYKKLIDIEAISKQEFDDVKSSFHELKADILVKKAELDNAQIQLDYTKVYAPISGKIGKSFVTEGALVTANQPQALAVITYLDKVYVDITQPSTDFIAMRDKINADDVRVELSIANYDGDFRATGKLNFAESIIDESTGSVALRAIFDNNEGVLLPGLFVRTDIILASIDKVTLPQEVVQIGLDGKMRVFVIDEGNMVSLRKVRLGEAVGKSWVIEDGITAGEVVVKEGFQKIRPGVKVAVSFDSAQRTADASVDADRVSGGLGASGLRGAPGNEGVGGIGAKNIGDTKSRHEEVVAKEADALVYEKDKAGGAINAGSATPKKKIERPKATGTSASMKDVDSEAATKGAVGLDDDEATDSGRGVALQSPPASAAKNLKTPQINAIGVEYDAEISDYIDKKMEKSREEFKKQQESFKKEQKERDLQYSKPAQVKKQEG